MDFKFSIFLLFVFLCVRTLTVQGTNENAEKQRLQLGTFDIDVTPPVGHDLAYDPMVNSWEMGLRAKGIVLTGLEEPIVIVALDWIGLYNGCHSEFRRALASAAGTTTDRVAVHTVHQHDAPRGNLQDDFVLAVIHRLEMAVINSVKNSYPVTDIGFGKAEVYKVASNRRPLGADGKVIATRFTTCRDSALRAEPEGVIDPKVSLISFWNENVPLAVMSFYATHPQSYYRTGIPNPDFPGIARFFRQLEVPDALHVHFNGAAGNIGAGKYNDGSHENRLILARRLADGMKRAWDATEKYPVDAASVGWYTEPVVLPIDTSKENEFAVRYKAGYSTDLQCMAIERGRILFMPGELFVEYQLAAQRMKSDLFVTMAAYGDGDPGYIPTAEAFPQGGYEIRVTKMLPEVESVLMEAMKKLLDN
ncbi:MAG: hypothetical protein GX126_17425 [Bacteroidales bacterium]|nr:hypothetical protein [Bacteroidales bacterium]